jgi:pimeloyl-ACP methyl ester carboxylesterase
MLLLKQRQKEGTTVATTDIGVLDKTVELNGLRFHYRDWGNTGAQALVCLHGFTSHAHSWDTFAQAVRDNYHVLALDQRGHGETEWSTDYHPQRRVEDLHAFVEALGLKNIVLLGLSMGGRCAYQYAAQHPDKIERLVIVDIAPETDTSGSGRITQGLANPDVFDSPEDAVAAARKANIRPPDAELRSRVLNGIKPTPDGKWTFRYDVALRNGSGARPTPTRAEIDHDWASLKNITSPTLLVRGAESDILSPANAQRMIDNIPNCRLVEVENSGHSVPLDNPTGFLSAVRTFL